MKKRESEIIVKTVLAGMNRHFAVGDIRATNQLRAIGVDDRQITKFKKRLLLALSGELKPNAKRFSAALKITPKSKVADVAAQLTKAYKESLPADTGPNDLPKFKDVGKGVADIAVRTALAQNSKHPAWRITPEMELRELGLDDAGMKKVTASIYKAFSGSKTRIKPADFIRAIPTSESRKVEDLVRSSAVTFSLSGDPLTRPRDRIGGIAGEPLITLAGDKIIKPRGLAGDKIIKPRG
jgi:hypothetical protein